MAIGGIGSAKEGGHQAKSALAAFYRKQLHLARSCSSHLCERRRTRDRQDADRRRDHRVRRPGSTRLAPCALVTVIQYRRSFPNTLETRNSVRQHSHPCDGYGMLSAIGNIALQKHVPKVVGTRYRVPPGFRKRKTDAVCSKNGQRRPNHSTTLTTGTAKGGMIGIGLPRNLPEPHLESGNIRFHPHQVRL